MDNALPYSDKQINNFVKTLGQLSDNRDNRGKRHSFPFVISSVVLAILVGRSTTSSIFRYIRNKIDWLQEVTEISDASCISRAHLPRILAQFDWEDLHRLIETHFGVHIERTENQEWVAIDGKVMKGTVKSGNKQAVVLAVSHESRTLLAEAKQEGPKSSEIPVVRQLLKDSELEKGKTTLDAHHCNPTTTAQINQANGLFLIQVKDNQPILLEQCKQLSIESEPIGNDCDTEKEHGRISTREAELFSMGTLKIAARWDASGLQTLVVVRRDTLEVSSQKISNETSYYITNQKIEGDAQIVSKELPKAIRKHWGVESDNWIRDVTLNEDKIKIKSGNQAQVMGTLRSLAMRLWRKSGVKNFQEAIENWTDSPAIFKVMLKQVKFL